MLSTHLLRVLIIGPAGRHFKYPGPGYPKETAQRTRDLLEEARPGHGRRFLGPRLDAPVAPGLRGDCVRFGEVVAEDFVQLCGEIGAEDDDVDLVVMEEASPVEVGRSHRRPDAVHGRALRVQD